MEKKTQIDTNFGDNSKIYERDNIKFIYNPFNNQQEGGEVMKATLKAIKGIDGYYTEFTSDKLGELFILAKDDIEMFNRIMIKWLMSSLDCETEITMGKQSIRVNIKLEILEKKYTINFALQHEAIDETILLRRKLEYALEKMDRYENTINYHFHRISPDYKYSGDKLEKLELPTINQQGPDYSSKIYESFITSKTDGIFAEISNYKLHQLLITKLPLYQKNVQEYEKRIKQDESQKSRYRHPLHELSRADSVYFLEVVLLIINHMNYELMDINYIIDSSPSKSNREGPLISIKMTKTNINYRYEISHYHVEHRNYFDNNTFYAQYGANYQLQVRKIKVV